MKHTLPYRILKFYVDGFKNLSGWGKQVWIIILVKLFIMFAILKLFFFPNFLKSNFEDDQQRGDFVLEQLTEPKK
ncbi:MAG: DUF4492 domain-containing protein [Prolixibacteraceae bacterium]|jgi:hypothetical protein|nr:DUF4492 domain-containing protein [Prolixibacteraceae bacterium]